MPKKSKKSLDIDDIEIDEEEIEVDENTEEYNIDDYHLEDGENLDELHPAEVAARYRGGKKDPAGGSDKQILKDLRKSVFSVPMMPQEEVEELFLVIDDLISPVIYSILETSEHFLEEMLQVVIKVIAGNTYGKNIYEKEALTEDQKQKFTEYRGTYKDHEIEFIENAYKVFRVYTLQSLGESISVKEAIDKCQFVRGVFEELLVAFVETTSGYDELHWKALQAKLNDDLDNYHRYVTEIKILDSSLKFNNQGFSVSRDARLVLEKYTNIRSTLIAPYLRSVYSVAKNAAHNVHQMLDNFQNGSMGLMRAVSCYSAKRKASFASFAKWWIMQMMLLSIKEDSNFVKLPISTWQAYTQLEKTKAKIGSDDIRDIAKATKMSPKKAKSIYNTVKISQVYSLNRTYDADEKLTLEDIMTNEDRLGFEDTEVNDTLRDRCKKARLTNTELRVLALRHGMVDLIPPKPISQDVRIRETVIQNLASLGYNFSYN